MARLLQYLNNISDWFQNILAILQYFQGIFLQYFLNLSVLCGVYVKTRKDIHMIKLTTAINTNQNCLKITICGFVGH